MKFKFWHKMTTIFGFLDEKCIRMDICSITSWLHPIIMSLELSQLYRDLYGKMAFWPQWRHQLGAANLWQATVAEEKQLLSCVFFCSSGFFRYFLPFWYWKWWQFPFKKLLVPLRLPLKWINLPFQSIRLFHNQIMIVSSMIIGVCHLRYYATFNRIIDLLLNSKIVTCDFWNKF